MKNIEYRIMFLFYFFIINSVLFPVVIIRIYSDIMIFQDLMPSTLLHSHQDFFYPFVNTFIGKWLLKRFSEIKFKPLTHREMTKCPIDIISLIIYLNNIKDVMH